jgi:hypothetical protein
MSRDSVVNLSTFGDQTGIGEPVSLRIDLNGLIPDGSGLPWMGLSLKSTDLAVQGECISVCSHGEKVTRLEARLEGGALEECAG